MATTGTPSPSPAPTTTAPAAPAPTAAAAAPKETAAQKIESFFTKFGHDLEAIANAGVNVAVEELPAIQPLLPPALYAKVAPLVNAAAQQVAAADAKYVAIGAQNVPYAVKVAEAVAVGGTGLLALAAQAGLQVLDLSAFVAAAGQMASSLNLTGITAAPKSSS